MRPISSPRRGCTEIGEVVLPKWVGYALLATLAAGVIAYAATTISDRFYRFRLDGVGITARGEVVGHSFFTCPGGIFCTERVPFPGRYGSAAHADKLDNYCGQRRTKKCHTLIVVEFDHAGARYRIEQPVERDAFRKLGPGSEVAVLVNGKDPASSLLRDHNPDAYRFWVSIALICVAWLVCAMFMRPPGVFPRR